MKAGALAFLRAGAPVLAWVLGFALTAVLARVSLPPAELPSTVREKLTHLAAHGDEYDAIFVGSSRMQNHVMPSLFDPLVAAHGLPMKSFNAGVASMHTPEDGWLLDHLLARKPARLRWIFLEIDFFQTEMKDDQKGTLRSIYWHDAPRFWQLCRRLVVTEKGGFRDQVADLFARLRDFIDHLAAFCQRGTELGRGAVLFDRWRLSSGPEPMDWEKLGEHGDGWLPTTHGELRDERTLNMLDTSGGKGKRALPKANQSNRVSQKILGETIARITRAGAVPILVIPPRTRSFYFVPSAENARLARVINLCDPAKYPALYDLKYRVDTSHLNAAGAEVFTQILADRFLEILRLEQKDSTAPAEESPRP